jgi:hypothetical protein
VTTTTRIHTTTANKDHFSRRRLHSSSLHETSGDNQEDPTDDGWDDGSKQLTPIVPPKIQKEPERDTFIPIFAVVSIMGLFGSYAYEMARLASRGELYLPWNN